MSRAEEAALKRFPEEMTRIPYQDLIEAFGGKEYVDFNSMPRGYFQLGYEQAEKDTMEQVVECELVCLKDRLLAVLPIKEFQWTAGDKIKIIIVKEGRHE